MRGNALVIQQDDIASRVRDIAQPLARAEGVELLSVKFVREGGRRVLRLTIDRDADPTSIEDCRTISKAVGAVLDADDVVPYQYVLEVSSAGLTRPLRTVQDFRRNLGRLVKVTLRHERSGALMGTLTSADEGGLTVELADGSQRNLALDEISFAQREISLNAPGRQEPTGNLKDRGKEETPNR